MRQKMKVFALVSSLLLNLVLGALLFFSAMQGCAEITNGRIGVLTKNIEIGSFGDNKTVFTLPKGLVVKEASATGVDWFEPHRFRLVITSENIALVDYSVKKLLPPEQDDEYYSADIHAKRNQK